MSNVSTCCLDVDTNLCITMNIYDDTGGFLRISDFRISTAELRVPMSGFRISERLDFEMFGLWFLDF